MVDGIITSVIFLAFSKALYPKETTVFSPIFDGTVKLPTICSGFVHFKSSIWFELFSL